MPARAGEDDARRAIGSGDDGLRALVFDPLEPLRPGFHRADLGALERAGPGALRSGGRRALVICAPAVDLDFERLPELGGGDQRRGAARIVGGIEAQPGAAVEGVIDPQHLIPAVELVLTAADAGEDVVDEEAPVLAVGDILRVGTPTGEEIVFVLAVPEAIE